MLRKKLLIISIIAVFIFFPIKEIEAAKLFFDTRTKEVGVGQTVEVGFFVDTQAEQVNAFEGEIVLPVGLAQAVEISSANSIISLWIEEPKLLGNKIKYSGIIPGGYENDWGLIFSIIFKTEELGVIEFNMENSRVLKHDGLGSEVELSIEKLVMPVVDQVIPLYQPQIIDEDPPENFVIQIAREQTIFDNEWFVVFNTQDKLSGIDYYRVQESRLGKIKENKWHLVDSPYVLKDQKLRSYIYVQAVDKAGNFKQSELHPIHPLAWYENYYIWFIMVLGVISLLFFLFILRKLIKKE